MTQWEELYKVVNEMMCVLCADGEIDTRSNKVQSVMDALHDIDGGVYVTNDVIADIKQDAERFKKIIALTRIEISEMSKEQEQTWKRILRGGWYEDDLIVMLDKLDN